MMTTLMIPYGGFFSRFTSLLVLIRSKAHFLTVPNSSIKVKHVITKVSDFDFDFSTDILKETEIYYNQ